MKINNIYASNFQALKVVEVAMPERGVLHVTGPNGAGKTSTLNAVFVAFGSATAAPEVPIRKGETEAEIRIVTDKLIVTRKFGTNTKGEPTTRLTVESPDGARYPSPQKMLDQLYAPIAFDPLEFARLDATSQYNQLRRLVQLEVDPEDLENKNRRDYEDRTEVNRDAARLRGQATAIIYPDDLPAAPLDVGALTAKQREAAEANERLARERARRERQVERIADLRNRANDRSQAAGTEVAEIRRRAAAQVADIDIDIADLERRIAELKRRKEETLAGAETGAESCRRRIEEDVAELTREADALDAALTAAAPLPEPVDTGELASLIEDAVRINTAIAERTRRETLEAEAKALEERAAGLTTAIEERRRLIREAIEAAKMPIPGLGFEEGAVTYNSVPLRQASSAEQLRVSIAIGMALNPVLRFMVIRDGVFLDDDSMQAVSDMAISNDYQLLIESIDPDGKVGVVMEEGEVAEVLTEETAAATKRPTRKRKADQASLL